MQVQVYEFEFSVVRCSCCEAGRPETSIAAPKITDQKACAGSTVPLLWPAWSLILLLYKPFCRAPH